MPFDPNADFEVLSDSKPTGFDPNAPFDAAPKRKTVSADAAGVLDYAGAAFGGFNKGLGVPVDLVNAGLGALGLPVSDTPFLGAKWFEKHGFVPPPPNTIAGRAFQRVGEEFGAAALPSAGLLKAASGVNLAAREAPSLWRSFIEPIARSPGKAATGEALATAGSGSAAAVARELAPDNPTAEALAQIVGGFAAPAYAEWGPVGLARKGVSKFVSTFSKSAQEQAGRQAVKDLLGKELTPDAIRSLDEASRLSAEIPNFNPSVAEATNAPGLIAQQRALEAKASGAELDRLVARRRANAAAVDAYTEAKAPPGPDNPDLVIDVARKRVNSLREGIEAQQQRAQSARERLVQDAFPVADRAETGATIRTQLEAERAARRANADQLSRQLGLDTADVTAEFTSAAQRVGQQFARQSVFEDMASYPEVLDIIQRAGRPTPARQVGTLVGPDGQPVMLPEQPARVTFQDLKALRERVSDDLIDAAGSANPSRKKVRMLTQLKEEVDGIIERAATSSADPTLAERYAAFRRAYFDDYIRPFEQGAALKVRDRTNRAFYKTSDEKVADAFFKAGDTSSADQFNAIFANRPEARDALRASVLDNLRENAVRDGVLDQRRLDDWMRRHRSVLDRFPDIADTLRTPAQADAALIARQEQLAGRQKLIEDRMLTRAISSYERGATADSVIDAALKEPRKMGQLINALRREDGALNALKRNVWEKATEGDAQAIAKFVQENSHSLVRLFGREHLNDILNIVSARAMLTRVPDPAGAAFVPRPLESVERIIGQGLPQLSSRIFAFMSGRVQKEYLIIDAFLRSLRGRAQFAADDALRAALYDPAIARELAAHLEIGSNSVVKAKQLQSRLIALGVPLLDRENGSPGPEAP